MNRIHAEDFDLSSTLESGQTFRYVRMTNGYLIHRKNTVLKIAQKGSVLHFDGADEEFVTQYFGLDENYPAMMATLGSDRTLREAMELYWGLRILRQDPWECLVSFLCSSTKSIAHIRVLVERLCRAFGEPVSFGNYQGYTFPDEGRINDLERLEAIGLGFRTRYIYQVNRIVEQGYLEDMAVKPYPEARALLMELPGVGEKVADCVLLFSMGFSEAFPIDTWIKRGMERTYFGGKRTPSRSIRGLAKERFSSLAGYAQQFLYHYWREQKRLSQRRDRRG
jgi:N-glycosylase/DNA lyase